MRLLDARGADFSALCRAADEVRRAFGDLVFEAAIPRTVRLAEAPSHGLPITAYDRSSSGADAYYRVARELVARR